LVTVASGGTAAPAIIGAAVVGAAVGGAASFGLSKLGDWAATSLGQLLPDQVYIEISKSTTGSANFSKIWPDDEYLDMNRGESAEVGKNISRPVGGEMIIRVKELDPNMEHDILSEITVLPGQKWVNLPITIGNEKHSSVYTLFITATEEEDSDQLIYDAHKQRLDKKIVIPGLEFYTYVPALSTSRGILGSGVMPIRLNVSPTRCLSIMETLTLK
jgi:hypothetical protein